jgi:hypothetical protein
MYLASGETESKQSGVYVPAELPRVCRAQIIGAAVCGDFFGSPVYGCSTIGLAYSRKLVTTQNQKFFN